jgi:hypothetical protein
MRLVNADTLPRAQVVERRRDFKNGRISMRHVITKVVRVEDLEEAQTVEAVPVEEHRKLCHEFYMQGKAEGAFEANQGAVVHGRWEHITDYGGGHCYGCCSNCATPTKANNRTALLIENNYCRYCGARMVGDVNG